MNFALRSFLASLAFTVAVICIAVCLPAPAQDTNDTKDLVIGANAGPYATQVKLDIKPVH